MSYYQDGTVTLHHGDCLDILRELPDASIDSVVTDPPYALSFMGKHWDAHENPAAFQAWCQLWATECLRVLKPGAHMLAFGGTRTWHRLACAVEDAGFEVRDSIAWMYGSGFPKSLDVSKAIDRAAGAERVVTKIGTRHATSEFDSVDSSWRERRDEPATPEAERWQGWGTALKPAHEPIVVARKPLAGTVAANVLAHGTGALNIEGCRVGDNPGYSYPNGRGGSEPHHMQRGERNGIASEPVTSSAGRWPANVVLDESQADALDQQSGEQRDGVAVNRNTDPDARKPSSVYGAYLNGSRDDHGYGGAGGASRFFYVAKADASERVRVNGTAHPTVKPLALMRWLVRLVTPPGGLVLEPFAGSGTTVEACILEGLKCVAIERETDYLPLIVQRINRRRDPVQAVKNTGEDGGLFDLLNEETA